MKFIENIAYSSSDTRQMLDLYLPDSNVRCVFVYFHGGGLIGGNKSVAKKFASYVTERNIALVSADYRIYPNASFPDFIYDAAGAVAWAYDYMQIELNCDKLIVGGSSAGGYLSMMLCFDKQYLESVGLDNSIIWGYFHDAGQPTAHYNVLNQSGIDPKRIIVDEKAPIYFVGAEKEYPSIRFIVSDNDMENRYEQTMLMLSTLRHFGYGNYDCVVKNGIHCKYVKEIDEDGDSSFGKMIYDFVEKILENERSAL